MLVRRSLVCLAAVAAFVPASSAQAGTGIVARALADWNGSSCSSQTNSCSGSPHGAHYSLGNVNLGGSGFLYVDGVLVDSCSFGPGGSCSTNGSSYSWTWDNDGSGCYTALAVTILIGGDVDQDSDTTFGC